MGVFLHSASVIGPGHILSGMPNQDAALTRRRTNDWLAVVSDGMGSRTLSDIGSRAACKAVLMATKSLSFEVSDRELIQRIYKNWLSLLKSVRADDAIATCLIAWGQLSGETRLLQLGDGMVLIHTDEQRVLATRSEQSFGNETTGLGLSRKYSDWSTKTVHLSKSKHGIILMTDGISDDLENLDQFAPEMIQCMTNKGARYGKRWITRELEAWPTPHHTDDKTIVVIHRT